MVDYIRKYCFRAILSCLLIFCAQSALSAESNKEIRAVWLTTNWQLDWPSRVGTDRRTMLQQQAELRRMLDRFVQTNINVVFFQARVRGEVLYNSNIEPWSRFVSGKVGDRPLYDPLAFAVSECHKRGLECHVWMVTMPLGANPGAFALKNTAISRNPKWRVKHLGEYYLDPGNPEVRQYIVSLVDEVTRNYDIDGIHLDYIRYPEKAASFKDAASYRLYGNNKPIAQWRRDNITDIVERVYNKVKLQKPWVKVSCATLGRYRNIPGFHTTQWNAYSSVYQEVERWFKDGKVDFIAPMMYYKEELFYPYLVDWVKISNGHPVVAGLGYYRYEEADANWSVNEIENQIVWSRVLGAQGQSAYRARNMLTNLGYLSQSLYPEKMYASPAVLPPMKVKSPRLENPSFATLSRIHSSGELSFAWTPVKGAHYYTIYGAEHREDFSSGNFSVLAARVSASGQLIRFETTCPEKMNYFVITASDRYNKESKATFFHDDSQQLITGFNTFDEFRYDRHLLCLYVGKTDGYSDLKILDLMGKVVWVGPLKAKYTRMKLQPGMYRMVLGDGRDIVKESFLLVR